MGVMHPRQDMTVWRYVQALANDLGVAMLTTVGEDGTLHARPMAVASAAEDALRFLVRIDKRAMFDAKLDQRSCVTLQASDRYVSVVGYNRIIEHVDAVRTLWHDRLWSWFPQGPDDPAIGVLEVRPIRAELWDQSGVSRVLFAWERVKASLTGAPVEREGARHDAVDLMPQPWG